MPLQKLSGDFVEQRSDSLFGKRHNPGNDSGDTLRITRSEWTQKNACLAGLENGGSPINLDGHERFLLFLDRNGLFETGQDILRQSQLRQR